MNISQNILNSIDKQIINREKWSHLFKSIADHDLEQFGFNISTKSFTEEAALYPRLLNQAIVECIKQKKHWYDFLELLMRQLFVNQCFFECSQDICRTVVKLHVSAKRQFTPYTLYFLLRCYDAHLVHLSYDNELLDEYCSGECKDWHLMFVASYQERFAVHCFNSVLESFMTRVILLSKLKCALSQKRNFLAWFSATLHLHFDEFMKNREVFRMVIAKLFEMLVCNGLINYQEMLNLIEMLIQRGQMVKKDSHETETEPGINDDHDFMNQKFHLMCLDKKINSEIISHHAKRAAFMSALFPLNLKNLCRISIKRYLNTFTRKSVDKLELPTNLKQFLLFEDECHLAMEFLNAKKSSIVENNTNQNSENNFS